jgi:DNA-binding phage protein
VSEQELVAIRDAGALVQSLERELAAAQQQRDALARKAVKQGVQMTQVARAAGLSRQRVAQIVAAA